MANRSLVFEYGPSAPIKSLHLTSLFCDVFSSICPSCIWADTTLFSKKISAPFPIELFMISRSNTGRSMTRACTLSPPMVNLCPEGEWMCAPLILFCTTRFFEMSRKSKTLEVTNPAHLRGSPICLFCSNIATSNPFDAISPATYPPMGPPPITATS